LPSGKLSPDAIMTVLGVLQKTGNAEPLDKTKTRWRFYNIAQHGNTHCYAFVPKNKLEWNFGVFFFLSKTNCFIVNNLTSIPGLYYSCRLIIVGFLYSYYYRYDAYICVYERAFPWQYYSSVSTYYLSFTAYVETVWRT